MTRNVYANRSIESFNADGFEVARRRRVQRGFALRPFVLFALTVVAFKIFLAAGMGLSSYASKMSGLAEGNQLERVAARVMVLDPVSKWAAEQIIAAAAVVAEVQANNTRSF